MKHMQILNKEKRDLESKLKKETDQIKERYQNAMAE